VPIDDVRAYWDARPCNLRHGTAPVGTREYFDQVEARKYRVEPHIVAFADAPSWRSKDVLEVSVCVRVFLTSPRRLVVALAPRVWRLRAAVRASSPLISHRAVLNWPGNGVLRCAHRRRAI
jgi:hypothetical protein